MTAATRLRVASLSVRRRVRRTPWATLGVSFAAAATTLFVVRLIGAGWSAGFPIFFPDSSSFLGVARLGPFQLSFWFGDRPIVSPLLDWVLGRNARLIVLAQTALYVGACWWMVVVLWRIVSARWARLAATFGVLAVAVQPRFALWNTHILSESVSISLGISLVAAWLAFVDRPSTSRLYAAWVVTALWSMTRDSNVLIAVVCTVPSALVAARWWRPPTAEVRRLLRRGAVAMLIVAVYVTAAQAESDRNRYPTLNVIGQRVLVDAELTDYYRGLGMPIDDAVVGRTGKVSWDDGEAFLRDPALEQLRRWAETRGQIVHLSSMVRFAPRFIDQVWSDVPSQLGTDHGSYDLFGVGDRLPSALPWSLGGPRDSTQLACWAMVAAAAIVVMFVGSRRRRHAVVLTLLLFGVALDVYVSWLGDSVEVQRHLVTAVARLGVVLVATIVIGLDDLFRRSEPVTDELAEHGSTPEESATDVGTEPMAASGAAPT